MNNIGQSRQSSIRTSNDIYFKEERRTEQYGAFTGAVLRKAHVTKSSHLCLRNMAESTHAISDHYSLNSNDFNKKITARTIKKKKRKKFFSRLYSRLRARITHMHAVGLNTVNSLHLRNIVKYRQPINSTVFYNAFKVLRGITVVMETISLFQQTTALIKGIRNDIAMRKKRKQAQATSIDTGAETEVIKQSKNERKKLKKLIRQNKVNLFRTKKQIITDKLLAIKNIIFSVTLLAESTMLLIARFTPAIGHIIPGVNVLSASLFFIRSLFRTSVQISALNNLASASAATSDPLLLALSGHIKQKRTSEARQQTIESAVGAFTLGAVTSMAITGELVSIIVAIGLSTITMVTMDTFKAWQQQQEAKKRKISEQLPADSKFDLSLATEHISVAEKIFLNRLRRGYGETSEACVKFLRDLGVSESSVKQLQFTSKERALKMLRELLYKDKLQYKGLQLWQTGKTLLNVSGLSAAGRRIKNGSQWLADKIQSAPAKLAFAKTLSSVDKTDTLAKISKVTGKPSLLQRFVQQQRGYIPLVNEESDE